MRKNVLVAPQFSPWFFPDWKHPFFQCSKTSIFSVLENIHFSRLKTSIFSILEKIHFSRLKTSIFSILEKIHFSRLKTSIFSVLENIHMLAWIRKYRSKNQSGSGLERKLLAGGFLKFPAGGGCCSLPRVYSLYEVQLYQASGITCMHHIII